MKPRTIFCRSTLVFMGFLYLLSCLAKAEDYQLAASKMGYFSAKPLREMARIMTHVKDYSSVRDQEKCQKSFDEFYSYLQSHGSWQDSPAQLKQVLLSLSKQDKLVNLPLKKHLAFYFRYPVAQWQQELRLVRDPFVLIAHYSASAKLAQRVPSARLFAEIDLTLSAYQAFSPFKELAQIFPCPDTLLYTLNSLDFFHAVPLAAGPFSKTIREFYQRLIPGGLIANDESTSQQQLLTFEVQLHEFLALKILKKRGIKLSPYRAEELAALKCLLAQAEESVKKGEEEINCPVCLEALISSKARCSTCRHQLCFACLQEYCRLDPHARCPICRADFGENFSNLNVLVLPLPRLLSTLVLQVR